ncbi:hypothetical protein ABLT15_29710, partial [Paraburkholderia tropica]|uniref:hypothetical protein n=1 Tax=Paraburkholderia tropica TaxID=92647 RepID=UPI0032B3192D
LFEMVSKELCVGLPRLRSQPLSQRRIIAISKSGRFLGADLLSVPETFACIWKLLSFRTARKQSYDEKCKDSIVLFHH